MNLSFARATVFASATVIAGCSVSHGLDNEMIADLAQNVRYVAGQVHAHITYDKPDAGTSSDNLIRRATQPNPTYMASLSGYYVAARRMGSYSSVLLCDNERRQALVEDAGCTSLRVEWQHKENEPSVPCDFSLDLSVVCRGR